ncbi:hypothetical protein DSO57_1008089 [Entomophthora muscae]|uniref:Uncharacterized protein n=1 Tax=Entomophthora muscae TaxID=34485 RepID=A0ACC2RY98_9FUNG|nr:hypothetical protein DSO57_1008089 [Entomophthora muscae]
MEHNLNKVETNHNIENHTGKPGPRGPSPQGHHPAPAVLAKPEGQLKNPLNDEQTPPNPAKA